MEGPAFTSLARWPFQHYRWILLGLFLVYMFFFDRYSVINQVKIHRELRELQSKSEWYRQQTDSYREQLQQVLNNPEATERFVRENYLMQRPGEKVFIIDR
ncbi:MAG: FtsB family cell division protein [Bacteroidales bacterium]